ILLARFDFVHALRILVNLLENAHKYSPPGTPIELSAIRDGTQVRITVADRGPGIPERERERIFQPFYRMPGMTPDVAGAGLGLGADGLSSSAYGPDEAFRALGDHTYLAVALALAVTITVGTISLAYAQIIRRFPFGGGGYVVATELLGPKLGVISGSALLVD